MQKTNVAEEMAYKVAPQCPEGELLKLMLWNLNNRPMISKAREAVFPAITSQMSIQKKPPR